LKWESEISDYLRFRLYETRNVSPMLGPQTSIFS
jgi:hypothetical protein